MANHKFITENFDVNVLTKLHSYIASLFGRKDVLRDFCTVYKIDYKPIKNKEYELPSKPYTIVHDELTYLASIRDKSILSVYEKYLECQLNTKKEKSFIQNNFDVLAKSVRNDERERDKKIAELETAKTPIIMITLEDRISVLKTKIANEEKNLADLQNQIEEQETILKTNRKNWQKQIEIIDALFQLRKERFDKSVSKRVRKHLNYTDCHSILPEYNASVKEIINGDYNEKEK